MAKLVLIAVMSALVMGQSYADTGVKMIAMPDSIGEDLTLTKLLSVNCTFSYHNTTQMFNLISLIVSRSGRDRTKSSTPVFQELASVNAYAPDHVNLAMPTNASVSGHIDTAGVSFLSLMWSYPDVREIGTYRCSALGVDAFGHCVEEESITEVTKYTPNLDDLIELVKLQQIQMDSMSKLLVNLTAMVRDGDIPLKIYNGFKDIRYQLHVSDRFVASLDYGGRYYLLFKQHMNGYNFESARTECGLQGGYLAEINDASEHNFVKDFLNRNAVSKISYIVVGASDAEKEGEWVFSHSHQIMNYTDWAQGQPSPGSSNCLLLFRSTGWDMRADICSGYSAAVSMLCEIPQI